MSRLSTIFSQILKSQGSPLGTGHIKSDNPGSISQEDLAKQIGVTRYTVNQILNGRSRASPATALKIEKEFGISAEHIVIAGALDALEQERALHGDSLNHSSKED